MSMNRHGDLVKYYFSSTGPYEMIIKLVILLMVQNVFVGKHKKTQIYRLQYVINFQKTDRP